MTLDVRKSASIAYVVGLVLLVVFCGWQGAQYALAARETRQTEKIASGLKPIELTVPPTSVVAVPPQGDNDDDEDQGEAEEMTSEEVKLYATYVERMGDYAGFLDRAMFGKAEIVRVEGRPAPDRPTRAPVVRPIQFTGVMGRFAILDDQLIRVGQSVSDARLLAITSNEVLLERNGESTSVSLFLALNSPNPGGVKTVTSSSGAAEAARRAEYAKKMKDRAAFLREQEQRSRSQQYRDTQNRGSSSKYVPKKNR